MVVTCVSPCCCFFGRVTRESLGSAGVGEGGDFLVVGSENGVALGNLLRGVEAAVGGDDVGDSCDEVANVHDVLRCAGLRWFPLPLVQVYAHGLGGCNL